MLLLRCRVLRRNTFFRFCSTKPRLTLFTSYDCPLCDCFRKHIEPYLKAEGLQLEEVDIKSSGNEDWFEDYKHDIPVLHFENKLLMKHHFHPGVFATRMAEFKRS